MIEISSRKDATVVTFFLIIIRGIFYFMRVNLLKIKSVSKKEQYKSIAIKLIDGYYYIARGYILKIEKYEYEFVIKNPYLYYFSTALRLHFRTENKMTKT